MPRTEDAEDFRPSPTLARLYPESTVGGFSRYDGFIEFYTRVNALLDNDSRVLDFGAGRGAWAHEPLPAVSQSLRAFHERVACVDGVDVDDAVLTNPHLSTARTMPPAGPIPFEDASYDVIVADYVLEHVAAADAEGIAAELMRVLRPGGWLAARTPNKWGMIGVGARAVPNSLHTKFLHRLQPGRKDIDVFPVEYHMNTYRDLRRLFAPAAHLVVYGHASEPTYFGRSTAAWRAAALIDRLTPPRLAPTLMVFAQKGR